MRVSRFPLWAFILTGYLSAGRVFAYIGVPPLFIGEAFLGWNVLRNRHNWLGKFVDDVIRGEILSLAIALHLLWGVIEVFRCMYGGRPPIDVLRTFAFNYYPLYILAGIAIGRDVPISQFARIWKIVIILYSIYCVLTGFADSAGVDIGFATLTPLVPVVTAGIWSHLKRWPLRYVALLGSTYPVIFAVGHGRGALLGMVAGLVVVALNSGLNLVRLGMGVVGVTILGMVVGPLIPGPHGQSPPLDPSVHIARLVGTFDPNTAARILDARGYHEEASIIVAAQGTARWRQQIWTNAIRSLNTTTLMALGQGHGASMVDLVPDKQEIHTPHNFSIYCIYYTGWMGLVIFCFFLVALLVRARRIEDRPLRSAMLGVIWSTMMVAVTGNCFETPFGAIPFYLFCGLGLGFAQAAREPVTEPRQARNSRRQIATPRSFAGYRTPVLQGRHA